MEQQRHFLSGKTIVVAGAGVAGLSFAIALRKLWNEETFGPSPILRVFERDTEEVAIGREGFSLSLRSDNGAEGLQTLKKLGILDDMIKVSITGLEHKGSFTLWDRGWNIIMKVSPRLPQGLPVGSMRIARDKMRKVLVDGFVRQAGGPDRIEWERWCVGVTNEQSGQLVVEINDGERVGCDLLIVADGASSKIRTLLRPNDKLHFAGVSAIAGVSAWEHEPPEPIDQDWGMVISGTGTALFASPVDNRRAVWSLSWRESQPRRAVKFPKEQSEIDAILREAKEKGSWLPPLWEDILQHTDTQTLWLMNAMDKPAFDHTAADHGDRVIFIGDANHAVSPFAGAGANLALMDGLDLASSLLGTQNVQEAAHDFDGKALPRAKRILRMSHFTINVAHAKGWMSLVYLWMLKLLYWLFMKKHVEMRT
ncbi:uncharacterized protein PV09_02860 [Verruconis gallopava]|uniref:FAD-binding domain-containing protein n=1 Tax=Verruconis gallopava TaxID=253628 RepID=A0A0D1Z0B6_9PEZI|nr:uncharacterized protein PV09_02860 [Verruconis gallopava]KIW06407.1 hypothetical protein PV09_02860 [Verruconis gallopava]